MAAGLDIWWVEGRGVCMTMVLRLCADVLGWGRGWFCHGVGSGIVLE